ncbi:MAG: ABC transporter substrate-binding protein [Thermomicrobiales bacterium]
MAHNQRLNGFIDDLLAGRTNRRTLMRRGAAFGIGVPALATFAGGRGVIAQDGGTVTFSAYVGGNPVAQERLENAVAGFEENSGIDVELNIVEHEAFKQAIRTYLASDDPPDVLTWFAGNRARFFIDRGLIMPVDDLFQEQGWEEAYPQGILAVSKGSDDQYYFVPTSYYHWGIFYRKSIFEQVGIETPPRTWDELLAAVDQLKEAGITPFTIGTNQPWTAAGWFDYLNMRVNGPEFHIQLTDGEVAYNSPEVKETFARWRELLDKDAFIAQPEALSWQDAVSPMVNGEAAMYLIGRFLFDAYPQEDQADVDFFQFPRITEGVPVGEDAPTDGYFASAKATNVDEAKQLLTFFGSAEYQQSQAEVGGSPAVHQEVPLDIYDPLTRKGIEMLQQADYIAQFYDRDTHPDMAERGMNAFIQFWNNRDDVDQILDTLDVERQRVFEADE